MWTLGITPDRGMVLHENGEDRVLVPPDGLAWMAERLLRAANERARQERVCGWAAEALGGGTDARNAPWAIRQRAETTAAPERR